jgi:hypothetical protein
MRTAVRQRGRGMGGQEGRGRAAGGPPGKEVSWVERWLSRWAPLSGAVAGIFIAVSFFSGGSSPDDNAPASQVFRFYLNHATGQKVSAIFGALGAAFLVYFAVAMASRIRASGGSSWLASGAIAGAVFAAAGLASTLAFSFVLANDIKFLTASSAQTLNVLENDFFLPIVAGFFVFGIVGGLAAVVGRAPVRWMGWVLFALGVLTIVPPISWFAFLAMFLWALVAGIWLTIKTPTEVRQGDRDVSLAHA